MANYWKETCVNCGREFLNNSGTTSFGCPDYCDALLRAEDYCLRTFGAPQRCPYVINPDAFGEDCEPCGKVAKYALIVNYERILGYLAARLAVLAKGVRIDNVGAPLRCPKGT